MDDRHWIRAATEGDLDRIGEIIRQAWEPIFGLHEENWGEELFGVLYANWPVKIKASVGRHLAEHPDWAFVVEARDSGKVAAFITYLLEPKRGIGIVGLNAVAAGLQGQGIGTKMYNFVMDRFREAGLKYAQVRTGLNDAQTGARRAYEKAGFNIERKEVIYYAYL